MASAPRLRTLIFAAIVAAQLVLAAATALAGPTHPIPMHFNGAGEVDRWGTREEAAVIFLMMAGMSALGAWGVPALARRGLVKPRGGDAGVAVSRWTLLALSVGICLLNVQLVWNIFHMSALGLAMAVIWAPMAVLGALLGKVGPNRLVGVRTRWTFASRQAWDKANRLAGRLMFWGGVVGLISAPFAPQPAGVRLSVIAVLGIALIVVVESWRIWRTDPERRPSI